jgi:hypothetical protein
MQQTKVDTGTRLLLYVNARAALSDVYGARNDILLGIARVWKLELAEGVLDGECEDEVWTFACLADHQKNPNKSLNRVCSVLDALPLNGISEQFFLRVLGYFPKHVVDIWLSRQQDEVLSDYGY